MLELRNVNTFYGNIQALRDVNIRINEGEIVTLIGANGAGKSTTLMTICGGTPPRSGEVLFRGHPIHTLRPNKIVALGISQVPEGRLIFPDLTVQENLDLGAFLRNDKDNIKKDLDYIFRPVPHPRPAPRPDGRHAVRRRTADAGDLPRDHGPSDVAPA